MQSKHIHAKPTTRCHTFIIDLITWTHNRAYIAFDFGAFCVCGVHQVGGEDVDIYGYGSHGIGEHESLQWIDDTAHTERDIYDGTLRVPFFVSGFKVEYGEDARDLGRYIARCRDEGLGCPSHGQGTV